MDFETKEMLRVVGRLIVDMSPGSIQDLGRKTEALSILRRIVQADEPAPEPAYPYIVLEIGDRLIALAEGRAEGSFLDAVNEIYQVGQKEGAYREQCRTENGTKGCPERDQEDIRHAADAIGLTRAAGSILGGKAARPDLFPSHAYNRAQANRTRDYPDDIEFFRQGGI